MNVQTIKKICFEKLGQTNTPAKVITDLSWDILTALNDQFISSDEVCERFGVSRPTVDKWIKLGAPSIIKNPGSKKNRHIFRPVDLEIWLRERNP